MFSASSAVSAVEKRTGPRHVYESAIPLPDSRGSGFFRLARRDGDVGKSRAGVGVARTVKRLVTTERDDYIHGIDGEQ